MDNKLNYDEFLKSLPDALKGLSDKELYRLRVKATNIFIKKVLALGKPLGNRYRGGNKPYFGAKSKKDYGFIYGACQNPASAPSLFSALPTNARKNTQKYFPIRLKDSSWRMTKSTQDIEFKITSSVPNIRLYTDKGIDPYGGEWYYFRNPHGGKIFGRNRALNKSFLLETNVSSAKDFMNKFSKDDLERLSVESWQEVFEAQIFGV